MLIRVWEVLVLYNMGKEVSMEFNIMASLVEGFTACSDEVFLTHASPGRLV